MGLVVVILSNNSTAAKFKTRFACEVKDFEPTDYLDRKEARKIDRFTQFALICQR